MKMKQTILAGIFASILVAGFVFYPLLVGSPQPVKSLNTGGHTNGCEQESDNGSE